MMSMSVVDIFKSVGIHYQHGERSVISLETLELALGNIEKMSACETFGQRVNICQIGYHLLGIALVNECLIGFSTIGLQLQCRPQSQCMDDELCRSCYI